MGAAMAATRESVSLVCAAAKGVPTAQSTTLCRTLAEVLTAQLAQAQPPRTLDLPRTTPQQGTVISLLVLRAAANHITAELTWQDGGRNGASGPLSSIAVGGKLSRQWYLSLSRNLLSQAGLDFP